MNEFATKGPGRPKKQSQEIKSSQVEKEVKVVEPVQRRIFKEDKIIYHDLFKLEVAKMRKNMMWYKVPPDEYVNIEHCHFYHTFDSSGKKQVYSTSVGGHFHEMEVIDQGEGMPPKIVGMSGPLKWAMVKNEYGRKVKRAIPVNSVDNHTHEVTYLQSDEVKLRKMNTEAVKLIGANANLSKKPADLDLKE